MAARSRHPLCRALVAGAAWVKPALVSGSVTEHPGCGLSAVLLEGEVRLGSRAFCGLAPGEPIAPELWLTRPGCEPVRFSFQERLRPDALHTVSCLRKRGLRLVIASGDGEAAVERVADALGIDRWHASQNPVEKVALIEALRRSGRRVLMVGDGLNDGPCLAAADVCASPASASDIAQTVADVVLPRSSLLPLVTLHRSALRARSVMQQNVALSVGYNCLFVPLAAAGYVTPWLAALAMSSSSLLVIGNAFLARTEPVA
jgi:Cu2+-exporting ATPase